MSQIFGKYMILGTSGVIWGHSGVILECRIAVYNFSVEPSIQKSQPSTLIDCVFSVVTHFELYSINVFHISMKLTLKK